MTWREYCAWRRTKTPPRDLEGPNSGELVFLQREAKTGAGIVKGAAQIEEITQASLELIGEVAELFEAIVIRGRPRAQLLDEVGDVIFCAVWALDAWSRNPLSDREDLKTRERPAPPPDVPRDLFWRILPALLEAGLLANAVKKLRYQRVLPDVAAQTEHILVTLDAVALLLASSGISLDEAIQHNMDKLNKRYPSGWVPGGGIR
jgi:NTP pyrophosphatase (non-canonical NTP hydrolase)